jgi:pheromone shutdown-related protein TraB
MWVEWMENTDNLYPMQYHDKRFVLIGTAHVSRESADLVGETILSVKPDTVCIELCLRRYRAILEERRLKPWNIFEMVRGMRMLSFPSVFLLMYFQRKIGEKLGVRPGEDMRRAVQAAESVGARVLPVDRDMHVTLSRVLHSMDIAARIRLLAQLIASIGELDRISPEDIEQMKKKDVLEALLSELQESFPQVRRVIIDERDRILAHNIRNAPGTNIVAVVGATHITGIQHYWDLPVDAELLEGSS